VAFVVMAKAGYTATGLVMDMDGYRIMGVRSNENARTRDKVVDEVEFEVKIHGGPQDGRRAILTMTEFGQPPKAKN